MTKAICCDFPLRGGEYMSQLVLPDDLTMEEADRLAAMVRSLVSKQPGRSSLSQRDPDRWVKWASGQHML